LSERESRNIMILGLGTGGLYASKAASITDRDARISIVEQRAYEMFSPRGLPYALEGSVKSLPEEFECKACGVNFSSEEELERHNKDVHGSPKKDDKRQKS